MIWHVEWDDRARRELRKFDKSLQREILGYLRERIATTHNPKRFGKGLSYDKNGLWRYRIHNYRLICQINEKEHKVSVVSVGHRREIYKSFVA